ncbi:MAG: DUF2141 domain-containing protein [Weeksellaceae bacterium]
MKNYSILIALLITTLVAGQSGKIKMEVSGIKNNKGFISLALYNNANDFTKAEIMSSKLKAKKGILYAYFDQLPAGNYAVAVLHDENKNDKMDFNFIGVPKESYGFSLNPSIVMKAPDFEDVRFSLKKNETKHLKIKLK